MRLYIASSWKLEPELKVIAKELRKIEGLEVDLFCDPASGRYIFYIDELDIPREKMSALTLLQHWQVHKAADSDYAAIDWCDVLLLILPCGKSSHWEAGYADGIGKKVYVAPLENYPMGDVDVCYARADIMFPSLRAALDYIVEEVKKELLR